MAVYTVNSKGQRKTTKKRVTAGIVTDWTFAYGLIERLSEMLEDDLFNAIDAGYKRGLKVPLGTIREWFEYIHHRTGRTAESFYEGRTVRLGRGSGERISYIYGFHKTKGGLTVIFFEYGTPRIKPEFVMYYSMRNNAPLLRDVMEEELVKAVEKKRREAASR